jgi:nucleoside phosphorylase
LKNINDLKTKELPEKSYDEIKDFIPQVNLLLVTANEIETFHVRQSLKPPTGYSDIVKVPHDAHTYFIGVFGEYLAVHVKLGKMGSVSDAGAILTVSHAIRAWSPKAVVMVGVAMGVDEEKQFIGDILVSETILSYEIQRVGKKVVQRGPIVECGSTLLNRFANVSGWTAPIRESKAVKILPGQILSGEKLIDNLTERNKILARYPQAIGAEMEGAGVYAACKSNRMQEWILVKGICDYGDGNKKVGKTEKQHFAAGCATSLCLTVFSSRVAFKSIDLHPIDIVEEESNAPSDSIPDTVEDEILELVESQFKTQHMHSALQTTIAAYLNLTSYQKAIVIKAVELPLSDLTNMSAHQMDREFFIHVQQNGLMSKLWQAIHEIVPFSNNQNPLI